MSFESDFDDDFGEFSVFNNRFVKKLLEEMDAIFKEVRDGKLAGTWETREINEPEVKGRISIGRFESDQAWEPLDPLKPRRRRPMPEIPFELPETMSKEVRDPLTDVFEEENAISIYLELPGEEEEDIHLKVKEGRLDIRARNFSKKIDLPDDNVSSEKMTSEYKNGVLRITLPKKTHLRAEDAKKQKVA